MVQSSAKRVREATLQGNRLVYAVLVGALFLWAGGASVYAADSSSDLDDFAKQAHDAAVKASGRTEHKDAEDAAMSAVKAKDKKKPQVVIVSDAASEEKPQKSWNLTFGYSLSHNIDRARPSVGNNIFVEPSVILPYKINLMIHLGLSISTDYPGSTKGSRNTTDTYVDMEPLLVSLGHKFDIDKKYTGFAITLKVDQLVPAISKYTGLKDHWYYSIKPSVGLSMTKWGFTLVNSTFFQKNAHKYTTTRLRDEDSGSYFDTPLNSFSLGNITALRYKFWKMDVGVAAGYIVGWRYNWSQQGNRIGNAKYSADAGIDLTDALNLSAAVETSGPERRNGGFQSDRLTPLNGQFTQFALTLTYTF